MTRPSHRSTETSRGTVCVLAASGIPQRTIAAILKISEKTLAKYYRAELDEGLERANAQVAQNLFRMATGQGREALGAACFWLKTRARWRETVDHNVAAAFDLEGASARLAAKFAAVLPEIDPI